MTAQRSYPTEARTLVLLLVATLFLLSLFRSGYVSAEPIPPDAISPARWPRSTASYPAPEPFSVSGFDALQAIAIIRRERLLIRNGAGGREIVPVVTLEAREVGTDERLPEGHRRRFDLILNGEPLDWERMYIEYGGRLVNLQLLYTYRNQRPVPAAPFILE